MAFAEVIFQETNVCSLKVLSRPGYGTGIRSGVGPWVLYCHSPLLLVCVVKVNYE